MEIIMHPIGVIRSPFTKKDQTPIQSVRSQAIGLVNVYLDGTPLLDIKPYVPDFDLPTEDMRVGWYETRSKK